MRRRRRSLISAFAAGAVACAILVLYGAAIVERTSVASAAATRIANGIVGGRPQLECGDAALTIRIATESAFFGRIYVKGHSHDAACAMRGDGASVGASLRLPLDRCFLRRQRVFEEPFVGLLVTAIVVIGFHPLLLTEVDSVFRLQCVYMAGKQRVATNLHVQPSPAAAPLADGTPMPNCKYECVADDGGGTQVEILDERGCTRDPRIFENLEYLDELTAGQTANVAKFADRELVYFQCQIVITRKASDGDCHRPICAAASDQNTSATTTMTTMRRRSPRYAAAQNSSLTIDDNEAIELEVVGELRVLDNADDRQLAETTTSVDCFNSKHFLAACSLGALAFAALLFLVMRFEVVFWSTRLEA